MAAMMRAVLKAKPEPGFVVTEVTVPQIGPADLLVKVKRAAICGTDSHIWEWDDWSKNRIKPPLVVGHEFCGEVVEVGSIITNFKKGDFVSAESHIPCGFCYQCRNDQQHICGNLKILGVDTNGCFADYIALPAVCAWKNTPDMDPDIAAIQEPLGNSVYAVLVEEVTGRSVAVFGCGPAGMFSTAVAAASGAYPVIAVIKHEFRREIMKKLGAHFIINKSEDVASFVLEKTNRVGVDVVMEMTGAQDAIDIGLQIVRKGGRFSAFGIPRDKKVSIDLSNGVIFKGANIFGINGRLMYKTWYKMQGLLGSGRLDPRPVITHTFKLEEVNEAMKVMKSSDRRVGKIVLTM
ncbi:MAG: L-threonine 3-dehydrogenase [Planctomycetota bacterium]